jgi:O-glycosyl hydrolase
MNEPDWNGVEGPQVGPQQYVRVLHKLAVRLDELGLGSTKLVGPDTASPSIAASSYYPAMTADPVVMDHLAAVAIHDYSGSDGSPVDVKAFADGPTGRLTVVMRNAASIPERVAGMVLGSSRVRSLAPRYSDAHANFESGADVAIDAEGRFTVDVPADSVETLTGTSVGTEAPPPVDTAPPTASITAGPVGTTASGEASFAFTSDDVTAAYE